MLQNLPQSTPKLDLSRGVRIPIAILGRRIAEIRQRLKSAGDGRRLWARLRAHRGCPVAQAPRTRGTLKIHTVTGSRAAAGHRDESDLCGRRPHTQQSDCSECRAEPQFFMSRLVAAEDIHLERVAA